MSEALTETFARRRDLALVPLAKAIEAHLAELLAGVPRIDRIAARAKSIDRFIAKATKLNGSEPKYVDPLNQIQDQVGARIIVFYKSDVEIIDEIVKRYIVPIEFKTMVPESESEFGYFGRHFILSVPTELTVDLPSEHVPEFFELQIKTLFQHAWSEADHDLGYKPGEQPLTGDEKRWIAYASAQAWGADEMFDRLFSQRKR
jgi:putative GTP pyrophosphokinase